MNSWDALLLGAVQGLTEFLPVSSSGHLVLFQDLLGISMPGITLEVMAHFGTLLSVVIIFLKDIINLLVGILKGDSKQMRFLLMLIIGSIPAAILGLVFKPLFDKAFSSTLLVGIMLLVTGLILWTITKINYGSRNIDNLRWQDAVFIGIAQGLAIIPGISRSGSTISASLWQGLSRQEAVRFSFLLSLPAVLGANLLEVADIVSSGGLQTGQSMIYIITILSACIVGIAAIKFFVNMLENRRFHYFAYYCWILGGIIILIKIF